MAPIGLMMGFVSLSLIIYLVSKFDTHQSKQTMPYRFFGSKTAYDRVRSKIDAQPYEPPKGCRLKQFYLLARHGSGYPDEYEIINMHKQLPEIQDEIVKSVRPTIEGLKDWTFTLIPEQGNRLTPSGSKEIQELADRYKQRFGDVLNITYSDWRYDWQYTSDQRTKQTNKDFLYGLFGDSIQSMPLDHKENDRLLSTFKHCNDPKIRNVDIENFISSPMFLSMLTNISNRMHFQTCISIDAVMMTYDICRYESAWKPLEMSPWCNVFEKEELKILEYVDDLSSYYCSGYGNKDHRTRAQCTPLKDMMTQFLAVTARKPYPSGIFRFTTSDVMIRFFTQFGLFFDKKQLEFDNLNENRLWRTSLMDPFASNIAFILMKCENAKFFVLTLLQEREIKLPACTKSPCSFDEFLTNFGSIAVNCNETLICE